MSNEILEPVTEEVVDAIAVEDPSTDLIVPLTGEAIACDAPLDELAEVAERLRDYMGQLADFRSLIVGEVTRRLDKQNVRTANVIGYKLTTNAPTNVDYDDVKLRAGIQQLIDADVLDESVLDKLYPPPKPMPPPVPKLDKREVNKLVKHPSRDVQVAIAGARTVTPAGRTLKIEPVVGDA